MSILSTNTKLIKVGQDYSAGSGISIDDHVISVTGEFGKTYSAGYNIDIYKQGEQLYISSKDWTNDIANASANAYNEAVTQIPAPFDPTFISAKVDNKLDTTAFTNWQNGQYSTDLQTIEGQISNKLDSSSFSDVSGTFYPMEGNPSGFLTDDNTVVLQYGTSTWAEFKSAYDAHKNIVMYQPDNGDITNQYATFGYVYFDGEPFVASFTTICYGTEYRFTLNSNNVWRSYSQPLQNKGNYYSASNPSGFITRVDLSPYQTIEGMTSYQQAGEYYSASNPSGFISEVDHLWSFAGGGAYTAQPIVLCQAPQENSAMAPYFKAGPGGITSEFIQNNNPIGLYGDFSNGIRYSNTIAKISATLNDNDVNYTKYNDSLSANDVWSLTGSVQKREIEYDANTSAITAIAGSAIGGGGGVPQSAFDELKASYDALSSLFATYSGKWLLPNEGV